MKKVYKAVTGIIVLAISPTIFATDVGIIPDNNCPQGSESITIYMDDEDTKNESKLTGWVGATSSRTKFKFCRVNGDQFKPLSNGEAYAVLKLSDSCPNNSIEFSRFFDNEDDRNNNQTTGNIYPNIVNANTSLKFCYFNGTANGMDSFPDIGVEYGVFAPKNFSKSLASGTIFTDDEDNNNANGLNVHGHPAIRDIIRGGRNTLINVHKVITEDSNYGKMGDKEIVEQPTDDPEPKKYATDDYTVYYPKYISASHPTPLIFMVAGGYKNDQHDALSARHYQTLIRFMVSHGNSVLVSKGSFDPETVIQRLDRALDKGDVLPYVDISRIGVVGHSTGGANAFNVLKYYSDKNYGSNGRFIFSFDPYLIADMSEADLKQLPSNTKVVIVQSSKDGKLSDRQTPRISLTIYSLLNSIPDAQKDYQVYLNDGHGYITGGPYNAVNVANMKHVLQPLDALMDYTFNKTPVARGVALEVGSDHPISDGNVTILNDSQYATGCDNSGGEGIWLGVDYCRDPGSLGL